MSRWAESSRQAAKPNQLPAANSPALFVVLIMALFCAGVTIVAQQPADVEKLPEKAAEKPPQTNSLDALALAQGKVADKYARLEQLLIRMAEMESTSNPQRAALLKRAAQQSSDRLTRQQLNTLIKLLTPPAQLKRAIDEQRQVVTDLQALLELLQSENRSDRLKSEKSRIRDYIKEVDRLIRLQKGVQGRTEGGEDAAKLAGDQDQLADRTDELAKRIRENEEGQTKGSDTKSESQGEKTEGDEKSKSSQGKGTGDSKKGKSSKGDKKSDDSQNKDGEDKEGKKSDAKGDDAKQPSDKKGEKGSDEKGNDEKKGADGSQAEKSEQGEPKESSADGEKSEKSSDGSQKSKKKSDSKGSKGEPKEGGEPSEADDSESPPENDQSQEQNPARQRLEAAEKRMREARLKLAEAKRKDAAHEQEQAREELERAKAELEQILRQLREEEVERTLALLEGRFRHMLEGQLKVYESTKRLGKIPSEQRTRELDIQASKLSFDESKLAVDADKALLLLREEGSSVAFPETVEMIRDDMQTVADRLSAAKVDSVTQGIEEEIIQSLEELIAALQKAQQDLKEKKQPPQPGQPMDPSNRPLVDKLAELRMIRSLQVRVNTRTQRYARLLDDLEDPVGRANDADLRQSLIKLAEMEKRVFEITRNIVLGKNE